MSIVHNDNNWDIIPDSQESLISTHVNYNSSDFDNSASVMSLSTPVTADTAPGTSASSTTDLSTDNSNVNELAQVHICQTHHFICLDCGIDYIGNAIEAQFVCLWW